ncbi:MAG TPA: rhodanese-like domain-containing protein [Myxococcales bacterium]
MVLALLLISAAADISSATLAEPGAKTPEVSTQELREILANRAATVLDSRPRAEYAVSHIPGALNVSAKPGVPISSYVSDVAEIGRLVQNRKDTPLVLYCNGPFCGKSKRLAEELVAAGYTSVRRYQLGIPVWRALGGVTVIEPDALGRVFREDRTAVFIDVRSAEEFAKGSVQGAKNIPPPARLAGQGRGRAEEGQGRRPPPDDRPQHPNHRLLRLR